LNALPPFVSSVLTDPLRSLFFLGHPVNDWNVRLRLHEHIFPDRTRNRVDHLAHSNRGRLMVAIGDSIDKQRSSALDSLGIARWEGSLSTVASLIRQGLTERRA
jgi:hypothetical protein